MFIEKGKSITGQSIIDYTILLGIVAVMLISMATLMKRGVQAVVKTASDQLADQADAEQDFEEGDSHLISSYSSTKTQNRQETVEAPADWPGMAYVTYKIGQGGFYGDGVDPEHKTITRTRTLTNMGYVRTAATVSPNTGKKKKEDKGEKSLPPGGGNPF